MSRRMKVLCPIQRKGETIQTRVGSAFVNTDGTISVYLDAFPANGKLTIKPLDDIKR